MCFMYFHVFPCISMYFHVFSCIFTYFHVFSCIYFPLDLYMFSCESATAGEMFFARLSTGEASAGMSSANALCVIIV